MLTLGAPLLIQLIKVSLHTCLLQFNHRTPSAQLIWITIISISIRIMRLSKDNRIVIEQQPYPSTNLTKASDIFLTPVNDDMVQHTSPINKSILQEIFTLDFEYAHNKSCIVYPPPRRLLSQRWRPPLKLSFWGFFFFKEVGQIDYSHQQQRSSLHKQF